MSKITKTILIFCIILIAGIGYLLVTLKPQGVERMKTPLPIGKIYYLHDQEFEETIAHLLYPIGEADMEGDEGIAHYLEHLVVSSALPAVLQDQSRDYNAFTMNTWSVYYMRSKNSSEIFEYLSKTAQPINLTEQFMKEEAGIVGNEFQLRVSESLYFDLNNELTAATYEGTGLTRNTIGDANSIKNFSPKKAMKIHQEKYNLADAILLIRSHESKDEITKKLTQKFSEIEKRAPSERPFTKQKTSYEGQDRKEIHAEKIAFRTSISNFIAPRPDYDDYEIFLLSFALNDLMYSVKPGLFLRKIEFEDKNFKDFSVYVDKMVGDMGVEFHMDAHVMNKNADYLATYFYKWVETLPKIDGEIEAFWDEFKDEILEEEGEFISEDEYEFVLEGFLNSHTDLTDIKRYYSTIKKLDHVDLVNFIEHFANHSKETSRIWIGEDN